MADLRWAAASPAIVIQTAQADTILMETTGKLSGKDYSAIEDLDSDGDGYSQYRRDPGRYLPRRCFQQTGARQ